jgi:ribosomal protein RSM22 (predicted rRNA methylase)
MRLPEQLQSAIEELSGKVSQADLRRAAQQLSEGYRREAGPPPIRTEAERMAYLLVRMPATYVAVRSAMLMAADTVPEWSPKSMLDLGAGPGTASWAATNVLPSLESAEAIEREARVVEIGRSLAASMAATVTWKIADLQSWKPERSYDVIVGSYSIGELPEAARARLISTAWEACSGVLILVEPGTRRGFDRIERARQQLISCGAPIAAPCPHSRECPMKTSGDWCHFSARVERTQEHRRLKQGELGYEDEKFSYVIASRQQSKPALSRIVRHPQRLSGHVKLQLCSENGLEEQTVTRSQKERYRAVKHADWGSAWD